MKLPLALLLAGISTVAFAATPPVGKTTVLKCSLKHSVPRPGRTKPQPFSQHFKVNLEARTVDGVRATVTADKVGWEPVQSYLRPYATLSLPDWQYHSVKWFGHVRDEISGPCVEE